VNRRAARVRFLLDANMPRRAADAIRAHGHECIDVRDIGLGGAPDSLIAAHARDHGLALLTRDGDFGDVRNYPAQEYPGIVVLDLPDDATAATVVALIESLMKQDDVLKVLPGRLAIVQMGRVRLRPTP
jgi:predicted nuclease of predicted toxin-antitoxin system